MHFDQRAMVMHVVYIACVQIVEFKAYRQQLGAEVDDLERINIDLAQQGYDLLYDPAIRK